jgi:hypothetical protein
VSILTLFLLVCNWLHSVGQNHFFAMMLLNKVSLFRVLLEDSASQKNRIPCSRSDDVTYCQDAQLSKASSVRMTRTFRPDLPLCRKLRIAPACICSDVLATCPDDTQCSTSYGISFHNTDMGRSLQLSGRCGFPSGHQSSWSGCASYLYGNCVHQINRPDGHSLGPDARKALIWKLRATEVRPSGR